MASPGKQYGYNRRYDHPPFLPALYKAQAKHEQEDSYRSHVHRTRSERLRSPIQRHGLEGLAQIRLSGPLEKLSCLRVHVQRTG